MQVWDFISEVVKTKIWWYFFRHNASFEIFISKVQDFRDFELSPMILFLTKLADLDPLYPKDDLCMFSWTRVNDDIWILV